MLRSPTTDAPAYDALAPQRERVLYLISIVICASLAPFVVINFVAGRLWLAWTIVGVVAIFAVDAVAIHLKKRPPIPFAVLVVPAVFGISMSLRTLGIIGALWCYPAVLFFHFVLSRSFANVASAALLISSSILVGEFVDVTVMIRFAVTLTLTVIIINIVLNIVTDLQKQLVDQATTDPLTGAFNRRQMDATLRLAIERHGRTKAAASILILDFDHFKRVNDQLGHEVGDHVLKGVVGLIQKRARKLDVLFRLGGEEFMLLLPDTTQEDALILAEHLRTSVETVPLVEGWPLTVTIGVAGLAGHDSPDSWIKRADDALYVAKKDGRNRVVSAPVPRASAGTPART